MQEAAASVCVMYMSKMLRRAGSWWAGIRMYAACMCKAHIHTGPCLYMSARQRRNEGTKEASERERESVSFVFTMNLQSPARATATPHPLYPQQMATRQLPADTHTLILQLNQTHTHRRKISFNTLSEMSRDPRCKMEWLKHMIRNREGSH